jgi:hypothetical protein
MATKASSSVDRTVERMLKKAARKTRRSGDSNGSASTAQDALSTMLEVQQRMSRGDVDGALQVAAVVSKPKQQVPAVRKPANGAEASRAARRPVAEAKAAPVSPAGRDSQTSQGVKPLKPWMLVVPACLLALLVCGGLFLGSALRTSHSVSGTLMLDQKPLAGIEVVFHPKNGTEPIRVKTSEGGAFHVDGLAAGDYLIALAANDSSVKFPRKYLRPESTPFRLNLRKDRADLRMIAVSK